MTCDTITSTFFISENTLLANNPVSDPITP